MAKSKKAVKHSRVDGLFARWNTSLNAYLARRPHRSFRRTLRRDYTRSFSMPGYFGLTAETFGTIGRNWRLFGLFFVLYAIVSAIMLGVVDQTNYSSIVTALKSSDPDVWVRSIALFGSAITGGLNPTSSTDSQAVTVILGLLAWLTMIWLLRRLLNRSSKDAPRPTLREGLYNAGAPIIPTAIVALVAILQCIPIILVAVGYTAASRTGLLDSGIEAMLFYGAAALLTLVSLYWLTSTFIALVVITLPGMQPFAALRAAGDLVVGRRVRLILRLIWITVIILLIWVLILFPVILLDNLFHVAWLPVVPVSILALVTITLMISSTYIYLLYRKLVEDDAKPA